MEGQAAAKTSQADGVARRRKRGSARRDSIPVQRGALRRSQARRGDAASRGRGGRRQPGRRARGFRHSLLFLAFWTQVSQVTDSFRCDFRAKLEKARCFEVDRSSNIKPNIGPKSRGLCEPSEAGRVPSKDARTIGDDAGRICPRPERCAEHRAELGVRPLLSAPGNAGTD